MRNAKTNTRTLTLEELDVILLEIKDDIKNI